MGTQFTAAYAEIVDGLASLKFSTDKDWQALVVRGRKFAGPDGFELGQASLVDDLRQKLVKADAHGTNEAVSLFRGAGETLSGTGAGALIDADLAKRLGALKSLRHTYLLKHFGAHKVWCMSLPTSFVDWPHEALKGGLGGATAKLVDRSERFTPEQRKQLSNASQEGLKWVHKAMIATADPNTEKNFARITRWFTDASSKQADVMASAAILNAGLKKLAAKLKSGRLIYTDSVSERGTAENAGTEAFVWGDALDVVYIEEEFFGKRNTLTGLTNWTRIVIHELTHRELKTKDHVAGLATCLGCTVAAAPTQHKENIMNGKSGSRIPAPRVAPVTAGGVRYEQVGNALLAGFEQMGGYLAAYDDATGKQLWTLKVYDNVRKPEREGDVQDVFFKTMTLQPDGTLLIENERGARFMVDPVARTSNPER